MKLWGLTGGIASGKSTAHKMFARLGAQLVDADAVYHSLLQPVDGQPSPLAARLSVAFGDILQVGGHVDRRRLGASIFADPDARRRLEALTHPAVAANVAVRLQQLAAAGCPHALYDVPLLYERDMHSRFAGVILVWVPAHVQLARLMARDGIDAAAAALRVAAQLPLDDKRARAHWVVDNSGSLTQTEAQVCTIWQAICQS
jgi:dephospho-CoA kinase